MPLLGGKNSKVKADLPKIRIERVVVDRPAPPKPKPKPQSLVPRAGSASSRSSPSHRPSPKPSSASTRNKSASPYPSSSDERRLERKRKAGRAALPRRSPVSDRVEFDKDSDAEDDGWMNLETRKRQRKGTADGKFVDPDRLLKHSRAFISRDEGLKFIHAADLASIKTNCNPAMGARPEDVAIELQYPSLQRREK